MVYLSHVPHNRQPSFLFNALHPTCSLIVPRLSFLYDRCTAKRRTPVASSSGQRRAPRTFVRLVQSSASNEKLLLQTATITYSLQPGYEDATNKDSANTFTEIQTIHIHSLLHLADPTYYESLQRSLSQLRARQNSPTVLFELLTSSRNLETRPYPRLKSRLIAISSARIAAKSLGAVAQVDAIDFSQASWRHADLTSDTILSSEPLTRPFGNIGNLILRATFLALPFPELYAALVDIAAGRAQLPIRTALVAFTANGLMAARRLTFAAKMAAIRYTSPTPIDLKRNTVAWNAVRDTLRKDDAPSEIALLYGAWHVPALCRCAETDGWSFTNIQWRTAMEVSTSPVTLPRLLPLIVIITAYATYSALDWVFLIARLGFALESPQSRGAVFAEILLYVVRHSAPYVAFWKWFRDWSFN